MIKYLVFLCAACTAATDPQPDAYTLLCLPPWIDLSCDVTVTCSAMAVRIEHIDYCLETYDPRGQAQLAASQFVGLCEAPSSEQASATCLEVP